MRDQGRFGGVGGAEDPHRVRTRVHGARQLDRRLQAAASGASLRTFSSQAGSAIATARRAPNLDREMLRVPGPEIPGATQGDPRQRQVPAPGGAGRGTAGDTAQHRDPPGTVGRASRPSHNYQTARRSPTLTASRRTTSRTARSPRTPEIGAAASTCTAARNLAGTDQTTGECAPVSAPGRIPGGQVSSAATSRSRKTLHAFMRRLGPNSILSSQRSVGCRAHRVRPLRSGAYLDRTHHVLHTHNGRPTQENRSSTRLECYDQEWQRPPAWPSSLTPQG